ncbi:glycoside hydrolase family 127 protein [Occallatibacter savannae]|uniref:glycoside hydrolase family 127 protein n=1 Tax=Occallatibacter savannae TaxID=1002691 RepID=UPI001EF3E9BE|nr:beta-L-arabinofuranosidase domain-containing protein [Occallatibacter savannae]
MKKNRWENDARPEMSRALTTDSTRREFLAGIGGAAALAALSSPPAFAQSQDAPLNVARVAVPSSRSLMSENRISALNDGFEPADSFDRAHALYAMWVNHDAGERVSWVQYEWSEPVSVDKVEVYWAAERPRPGAIPGSVGPGVQAPQSYRVAYWNGSDFAPVKKPQGLGVALNAFNTTTFEPVKTTKLRLEVVPQEHRLTGILEWRVFNHGPAPALPPVVDAGVDRSVVSDGKTYLSGKVSWLQDSPRNKAVWKKTSGPGAVAFAAASSPVTTAAFLQPGDYVLELDASGSKGALHRINVHVEPAPPADRLDVVYTRRYSIDSPLWNARAKALIVDWIPHCIAMCERTDIAPMRGDGGIDNFVEAGKANRGEPHGTHKGFVFSNAWVHQTVESMCIALMVDPQGDAEIVKAQELMRGTLERWIPIILAAQMPDGYLQTAYILADRKEWPERWSPDHRGNHEGYVSGYFIESAINHYTLTDGKDLRLYNAAKKLADCWVANIGPGKKEWFDGHQEMEQALVRFGRFVNDQQGNHRGDAYIALAKFLLDSRRGGSEYDQSHLPPGQQYEAVGHAVRAMYFYSGMADIAAETQDRDYQSAVISLWDNMVNRKYYVTGGIGSGETSEGFGPNYSLRNEAYCETCSSCGVVFFQYKLNLAYHDAKYADLYEQTMYNALLGGVALDGKSFCYTNPLVNTERAKWHICPCCVGNVSRTLLMIPTWSYVKSKDALFVNMFVGSRVRVGEVAGTNVEIVQKTDYPWRGAVAITVNPEEAKTFSVHVRIPNRTTSKLYKESPAISGVKSLKINGEPHTPEIRKGYAVITREWNAGDRIELELPMEPQCITADERIAADRDQVAFKYGPLIYNVETADNQNIHQKIGDSPLQAEWRPDLLGGVMVINGRWEDGSELIAIPNFARMNRVGPPPEYPSEREDSSQIDSKVWI